MSKYQALEQEGLKAMEEMEEIILDTVDKQAGIFNSSVVHDAIANEWRPSSEAWEQIYEAHRPYLQRQWASKKLSSLSFRVGKGSKTYQSGLHKKLVHLGQGNYIALKHMSEEHILARIELNNLNAEHGIVRRDNENKFWLQILEAKDGRRNVNVIEIILQEGLYETFEEEYTEEEYLDA